MAYADLRNFLVFRKVFGQHPRVLMGLLNDLLERDGDRTIAQVEYPPSGQTPRLPGMRLSLLDVRCREKGGATFFVEMRVLPVTGFLNRTVFHDCKAYVGTLACGARNDSFADVVVVSICDFTLWPDDERVAAAQPRVPLVSRWQMTEQASGAHALGQVQYVFMELSKLGAHIPDTANERWAALFALGPDLTPERVARMPLHDAQREALELAREEIFTAQELDDIERCRESVDQVRRTVLAEAATAEARGRIRGRTEALLGLLARRGFVVDEATRARIVKGADLAHLDAWFARAITATTLAAVFDP